MWKVSFGNPPYMMVERFPSLKDPKATVVTMTATVKVPSIFTESMPTSLRYYMDAQRNPKVNYSSISNTIIIEGKGKAIRQDGDKNNPKFAKELAMCKAKMKIYRFLAVLLDKYTKYYIELLIGKGEQIFPKEPKNDSLCALSEKYYNMWDREYKRWCKLLDESKEWD